MNKRAIKEKNPKSRSQLLVMKDMKRFTLNQLNNIKVTLLRVTELNLLTFGKHSLGFLPANLTDPRLIFTRFLKLS